LHLITLNQFKTEQYYALKFCLIHEKNVKKLAFLNWYKIKKNHENFSRETLTIRSPTNLFSSQFFSGAYICLFWNSNFSFLEMLTKHQNITEKGFFQQCIISFLYICRQTAFCLVNLNLLEFLRSLPVPDFEVHLRFLNSTHNSNSLANQLLLLYIEIPRIQKTTTTIKDASWWFYQIVIISYKHCRIIFF
jgi:hypothetical protein